MFAPRLPLLVLALLALAALDAGARAAAPTVTVEFDRAPLVDVVRFYSTLLERNFVVADGVYGERVTILAGEPVSREAAWEAFLAVLEAQSVDVEQVGPFWVLKRDRRRPPLRTRPAATPDGESAAAPVSGCPPVPRVEVDATGTRYSVSRAEVAAWLDRSDCSARCARIVPNYRGGVHDGYRFYSVREGSLLRALGFRNGDTLLAVDDRPLDSPDAALAAFQALRTAEVFTIRFLRRDEELVHRYRIVDGEEERP